MNFCSIVLKFFVSSGFLDFDFCLGHWYSLLLEFDADSFGKKIKETVLIQIQRASQTGFKTVIVFVDDMIC